MTRPSTPPAKSTSRSRAAKILRGLLALLVLYLALSAAMAWALLHPPRRAQEPPDLDGATWTTGPQSAATPERVARAVRIPPVTDFELLAGSGPSSRVPGPTLGASYLPHRAGSAASPGACLLLHGRGGHRGNMDPVARLLARNTPWAILAVDQRACGTSDDAPSTAGIAEADDVRAALAFLRSEGISPERVVAVGISQGAVAALLASEGEPLAGLALLAPYDDLGDAIDRRLRHFAGLPRVPWGLAMCQFGEWFAGRSLFDVDLIQVAALSRAGERAVWCRKDDWRAPPKGAQRLATALNAGLHVQPGSDHWLFSGPGSDQVLEEVTAFVSSILD